MKFTAKQLGTTEFIADYICSKIEDNIMNKVYYKDNTEKEYIFTLPNKYKNNEKVINAIIANLTNYGYKVILHKNQIEDSIIQLQITW